MKKFLLAMFVIFNWLESANAQSRSSSTESKIALQLGAGLTSFSSGRLVPSAYLGLDFTKLGFSAHTTGYRSRYEYMAGYVGFGFYRLPAKPMIVGTLEFAVGIGAYFSRRGFRDRPDQPNPDAQNLVEWDDANGGPAFRVGYSLFDFLFVRIETLLAISSANNIFLSFQDLTTASMGVDF